MRSSTARSAASFTDSVCSSRTRLIAESSKSRIIDSTSRPWYPTSVYFVASTLMNGAFVSPASRRAISVFPTPVGPIIRMFFGLTSCRSDSPSCCRRHRFRIATATARFASAWPTMYLSSSATICLGVRCCIGLPPILVPRRPARDRHRACPKPINLTGAGSWPTR
jgi:hypothetical protein